MPNQEMIDRIIVASFNCWNARRGLNYTAEDLSITEKEFARDHAIAIVKAMREPTEKMIDAAFGKSDLSPHPFRSAWHTMIDSILND